MYRSARLRAAETTRTRTAPICICGSSMCSSCNSGPWPPMSARIVVGVWLVMGLPIVLQGGCDGVEQALVWFTSQRGQSAQRADERGPCAWVFEADPAEELFEHGRAVEVDALANQVLVGVEDEVGGHSHPEPPTGRRDAAERAFMRAHQP